MSLLILIWAIGLLIMYVITLYKLFKFTFSKETKKEEENHSADEWGDF